MRYRYSTLYWLQWCRVPDLTRLKQSRLLSRACQVGDPTPLVFYEGHTKY